MLGTKTITELIQDKNSLKNGRINIIEAPVSSGKTYFALTKLVEWAGNPEKILYLIDTNNGEMSIQRNIVTTSRQDYAFWDYNKKQTWGESFTENKMPVMTYAGFGAEVLKNSGNFCWLAYYDYIVCDEMQNLVNYRGYENKSDNLAAAEIALRLIAAEGVSKIVALSATPEIIREHYKDLCYDVPFDRSDIVRLKTTEAIPYNGDIETLLKKIYLQRAQRPTGILYTTEIEDMKRYISFARSIGVRAEGFWSIKADKRMTQEQLDLRKTVLKDETIPEYIDLLVINAASETCIKIKSKNRIVDFMIVHNSNEEVKTQVRGRYHGDLPVFYYHDIEAANIFQCQHIPQQFLNKRLYSEDQEELCAFLHLRDPKAAASDYYKMRKVREYLEGCGYHIDYKKDTRHGGKHFYMITAGKPL